MGLKIPVSAVRFHPEAPSVLLFYTADRMREWLSGRASPCQGERREFESRLPLHHKVCSPPEMQTLHTGVWRSLVACLTGGQEASGSSPDTPTIKAAAFVYQGKGGFFY